MSQHLEMQGEEHSFQDSYFQKSRLSIRADVSPQVADSNVKSGDILSQIRLPPTVIEYFIPSLPGECIAFGCLTTLYSLVPFNGRPQLKGSAMGAGMASVFISWNPSWPITSQSYFQPTNEWNVLMGHSFPKRTWC